MKRPIWWSLTFSRRMLRETLLQNMFHDALSKLDIPSPALYPTGASANYGLFYLILRIISENGVARVLDIGAGQSTLLLDALAKKYPIEVVTLETDSNWAERIGGRVAHNVIHSGLDHKTIKGVEALGYRDLSAVEGQFDLILVDAPIGSKRHSRWAAIELIDKHRAPECVIIFDDAERSGERDTIKRFESLYGEHGITGRFFRPAAAQQYVACTPKFSHIFYYRWS